MKPRIYKFILLFAGVFFFSYFSFSLLANSNEQEEGGETDICTLVTCYQNRCSNYDNTWECRTFGSQLTCDSFSSCR